MNVNAAIHEAWSRMMDEDIEELLDNSPKTRFMRILHKMVKVRTTELYWRPMGALISGILKPVRWELDLRDSFCFKGCCGMQASPMHCFMSGFILGAPSMMKLKGLNGFDDSAPETIADELACKLFILWTLEWNGWTDANLVGVLGDNVNVQLLREADEEEQVVASDESLSALLDSLPLHVLPTNPWLSRLQRAQLYIEVVLIQSFNNHWNLVNR